MSIIVGVAVFFLSTAFSVYGVTEITVALEKFLFRLFYSEI